MIRGNIIRFAQVFIFSSFLGLLFIGPVEAETELLKTLVVTGDGMENISATIAEVELGVEIQGKTATAVQQEIAKRTSAIVNLLRSQDVKQLQTTGVRLDPNYNQLNPDNNQIVITSYTGTSIVSFRTPTDLIGNLLDEVVEVGASRIDRISFKATDEAISIAKKEALNKASTNAKAKANIVLEALNLRANEIVNIEVDQANISQPQPFAYDRLAISESRVNTPIIPGEQTVEASVTLQISYSSP